MSTPAKYQREPAKCERKAWLYEQYWAKQLSCEEIAEVADAALSGDTIRRRLVDHGIPRRRGSSIGGDSPDDPLAGFRLDEEETRADWSRAVDDE